jgi:hypothetical protein
MPMKLIDLATISRRHFFFFVEKCNEIYRSGHDLAFYRDLISMHRETNNLATLIEDEDFLIKLYNTLEEWDMNKRGARMCSSSALKESVKFWKNYLVELYDFKLYDDLDDKLTNINERLEKVFSNLQIMESKRKIVGVSKALHFLLPDLVMPIDSTYTMPAFYGYNKYSNSPKKEFRTFSEIFEKTFEITNRLQLSPADIDGVQWKTSVPKLIDNAVIGLLNSETEEVTALLNEQR